MTPSQDKVSTQGRTPVLYGRGETNQEPGMAFLVMEHGYVGDTGVSVAMGWKADMSNAKHGSIVGQGLLSYAPSVERYS